jgi:hypothetical protein
MPLLRIGLAILFFVPWTLELHAQEMPSDVHQRTAVPSNARYEIVQSEIAAKWTFRLDRFSGHVSQLVQTKAGESSWEVMPVIALPTLTTSQATRPRFQIFTSGLAAKFTFLIDTDTGKTWQLTTTKSKTPSGEEFEYNSWEPFNE